MASKPPTGAWKAIPVQYIGLDDLPIPFVNSFLVQSEKSEFVLSFGVMTPPLVLPGTKEQVDAQWEKINSVPINMLVRVGMTEQRFRELLQVLTSYLKQHEEREARRTEGPQR